MQMIAMYLRQSEVCWHFKC